MPLRMANLYPCGRRLWVALAFAVLAPATSSGGAATPARINAAAPCTTIKFEGDPFTVCRFAKQSHELRLVSQTPAGVPLRGFAAVRRQLGADSGRIAFAMNAGMYDEAGRPIGLYVENGSEQQPVNVQEGEGNFHMHPNGVFSVGLEGVVRVETTAAYVARGEQPLWATQSGPMLLIDGALHPRFQADGASRHVRNGVCAPTPASAAFVISQRAVSFGRFARFFRDELGCRDALYLDGVVSSLWAPSLARMDSRSLLGPMVVVLERRGS